MYVPYPTLWCGQWSVWRHLPRKLRYYLNKYLSSCADCYLIITSNVRPPNFSGAQETCSSRWALSKGVCYAIIGQSTAEIRPAKFPPYKLSTYNSEATGNFAEPFLHGSNATRMFIQWATLRNLFHECIPNQSWDRADFAKDLGGLISLVL